MDDLISRKWLMECVEEGWINFDTEKDTNKYIHLIRDTAPSADTDLSAYIDKVWRVAYERGKKEAEAERKRGKWINVNKGKWNVLDVLKCSACGEIDNRMYRTDSYCPNCGAEMTGGDEE